jgi:hypothetical protein
MGPLKFHGIILVLIDVAIELGANISCENNLCTGATFLPVKESFLSKTQGQ